MLLSQTEQAKLSATGLWPATKQPHTALIYRLMVSTRANHGLVLICRPQRDGRLSWPGWLTHSGHLTHKVATCKPQIRWRPWKVHQPKTDVLTTEPLCQPWRNTSSMPSVWSSTFVADLTLQSYMFVAHQRTDVKFFSHLGDDLCRHMRRTRVFLRWLRVVSDSTTASNTYMLHWISWTVG